MPPKSVLLQMPCFALWGAGKFLKGLHTSPWVLKVFSRVIGIRRSKRSGLTTHQSIFIAENVTHCPFFRFDDDFWYPEGPYKGKIADFGPNSSCELFTVLQIFCVWRVRHSSNKCLQCSMGPRLSKKCCGVSRKCGKHFLWTKTQRDGHFFRIWHEFDVRS